MMVLKLSMFWATGGNRPHGMEASSRMMKITIVEAKGHISGNRGKMACAMFFL